MPRTLQHIVHEPHDRPGAGLSNVFMIVPSQSSLERPHCAARAPCGSARCGWQRSCLRLRPCGRARRGLHALAVLPAASQHCRHPSIFDSMAATIAIFLAPRHGGSIADCVALDRMASTALRDRLPADEFAAIDALSSVIRLHRDFHLSAFAFDRSRLLSHCPGSRVFTHFRKASLNACMPASRDQISPSGLPLARGKVSTPQRQ
jgi:hypothetical protein